MNIKTSLIAGVTVFFLIHFSKKVILTCGRSNEGHHEMVDHGSLGVTPGCHRATPGDMWHPKVNIGSLHTERVIGVGILGIYRWLPPIQANTTWGERYLIYGIVWNVQISNLKWPWMSTLGFISVLTMLHDPRTTTSRLKVWYRDFWCFKSPSNSWDSMIHVAQVVHGDS